MAKSKVISTKKTPGVKGGSGKMFGRQYAGPQKSGTTATGSKSGKGAIAKGGSGHMFPFSGAKPAKGY